MIKTLVLSACAAFLFASCSRLDKSETPLDPNKARLQILLTDDPGNYQEVLIDIREIRINNSTDTVNGWQTLTGVSAGQYDLLKLVNDDDTVLANVDLTPGRIEQIRLVLGPDNFVKIDNQLIRLETPSAQQSGLKLNIHHDVLGGILYVLTLDFDVARSIVKTGNGRYMLKPVIRTILSAAGGTIQGHVKPFSFQTSVQVIRGPGDTVASTYSSLDNGGYRIRGLSPATYSLYFIPNDATYGDTVISGINVTNGMVTVVDTMRLQ